MLLCGGGNIWNLPSTEINIYILIFFNLYHKVCLYITVLASAFHRYMRRVLNWLQFQQKIMSLPSYEKLEMGILMSQRLPSIAIFYCLPHTPFCRQSLAGCYIHEHIIRLILNKISGWSVYPNFKKKRNQLLSKEVFVGGCIFLQKR